MCRRQASPPVTHQALEILAIVVAALVRPHSSDRLHMVVDSIPAAGDVSSATLVPGVLTPSRTSYQCLELAGMSECAGVIALWLAGITIRITKGRAAFARHFFS